VLEDTIVRVLLPAGDTGEFAGREADAGAGLATEAGADSGSDAGLGVDSGAGMFMDSGDPDAGKEAVCVGANEGCGAGPDAPLLTAAGGGGGFATAVAELWPSVTGQTVV
jgi:hypothetical protein